MKAKRKRNVKLREVWTETDDYMRSPRADELRAVRLFFGMTQVTAARLAHCELRTWEDYEGGRRAMENGRWRGFLHNAVELAVLRPLPAWRRLEVAPRPR